MRRLLLPFLLALVFAPNALAARPDPALHCTFEGELESEHFVIHWTGDPLCAADRFYEPKAGEALAHAEAAYTKIVGEWGFPAPLADGGLGGNDKVDIYVYDTTPYAAVYELDGAGNTTSGWFGVKPVDATKNFIVGSGVFHVSSLAVWAPDEEWFNYGTYEWAGLRAFDWPEEDSWPQAPDITLDCFGTECDEKGHRWNGEARWPFFQYLQDRFGSSAVKELYQLLAGGSTDGIDAVQDYLGAKGTNLTDVFNDFAGDTAAGSLSPSSIKGKPPIVVSTTKTGEAAATLTPVKVAVNHLAARFVAFTPGSGENENVCHPATLTVTVDVPAGTNARPKWYFNGNLATLSVSGSKASLVTAWDTCTWEDERTAYLSLPNPSTIANGKEFKVTAVLSAVDKKTILSPNAPAPVADPRPSVATQGASPPPTLTIYGASPLQVGADRVLALHFFASNPGSVKLSLDGRDLGTLVVRAGQNLFRLRLPELKQTTRTGAVRTKASAMLSLTSVSPTGQSGGTVERKVAFAKPKAKAKAAAKRPAAPGKPRSRR